MKHHGKKKKKQLLLGSLTLDWQMKNLKRDPQRRLKWGPHEVGSAPTYRRQGFFLWNNQFNIENREHREKKKAAIHTKSYLFL